MSDLTKPTATPNLLLELSGESEFFLVLPLEYETVLELIRQCERDPLPVKVVRDETLPGVHVRHSRSGSEPLVQAMPVHQKDLPDIPIPHNKLQRVLSPPSVVGKGDINSMSWLVDGFEQDSGALHMSEPTFAHHLRRWALFTAPKEDIPELFTKVATESPHIAARALDGLEFIGLPRRKNKARDLMPMLTEKALMPLLSAEEHEVRQKAILCINRLSNPLKGRKR